MAQPYRVLSDRPAQRRRGHRGLRRLLPLVLLAVAAFAGGAVAGARGGDAAERRAVLAAFAAAWERGDHRAMHGLLSPQARRRVPLRSFRRAYERAAEITTAVGVDAGMPVVADGEPPSGTVPVRIATRTFGTLRGELALPLTPAQAGPPRIAWARHHVHPGLAPGQKLSRETEAPPRARLLARDGTVISSRDGQPSPIAAAVAGIAGSIGPAQTDADAEALAARGFPPGTPIGLSGLERQFEIALAGTPGGSLRGGGRLLARAQAKRNPDVKTSIDPEVQTAAVAALAGRVGGVAVLRPRTGEVLALAGLASSSPQPPGSTFKIVTLVAALEQREVTAKSSFPVETKAVIEGVEVANHDDEACGGSLTMSFAESCNSVFAPLGAAVGAQALVDTAERFGWNEPVDVPAARPATIPAPEEIGDDLAVGASAIGQGKVLATPLTMASVAATIATRGRRARATLVANARGEVTRATSTRVARTVGRMMRAVVTDGTGALAAIEGVPVAGKTGTAELRSRPEPPELEPGEREPVVEPVPPEQREPDTDAWFTGYAPADKPRVAAAAFLLGFESGGDVAAPLVREVLRAGLRATR